MVRIVINITLKSCVLLVSECFVCATSGQLQLWRGKDRSGFSVPGNGRRISDVFSITVFYTNLSTNIKAEGSDLTLFPSTFMFCNLKHVYLEFCEPENDPVFVSDVLAAFLARCESMSGWARWKAYWKTEVWGQSGHFQTSPKSGEQSLTDLTPSFFSPNVWEISGCAKACGGCGGCESGSKKKTIELQTPARSFLEVSNLVTCGHVTQGVLAIAVVK